MSPSSPTNLTVLVRVHCKAASATALSQFEQQVAAEVATQNAAGYRVTAAVPLTGSSYSNLNHECYGESFTCAVLLIFEK